MTIHTTLLDATVDLARTEGRQLISCGTIVAAYLSRDGWPRFLVLLDRDPRCAPDAGRELVAVTHTEIERVYLAQAKG